MIAAISRIRLGWCFQRRLRFGWVDAYRGDYHTQKQETLSWSCNSPSVKLVRFCKTGIDLRFLFIGGTFLMEVLVFETYSWVSFPNYMCSTLQKTASTDFHFHAIAWLGCCIRFFLWLLYFNKQCVKSKF